MIKYKFEGLEIIAEKNTISGTHWPVMVATTLDSRSGLAEVEAKLTKWYNKSRRANKGRPDCLWVIDYKDGTKEFTAVKDFKQNQIQLMYGNHNFNNCTSRVNWWALTLGEANLSTRVPPSTILSRFGNTQVCGAATGTSSRTETGQWTTERLVARDGIYLIGRAMNQPSNDTDAIIIRLRQDAPLIKVEFILSVHSNAVYEQLAAFTGRGDIIPPEEAYNTHEFKEALKEDDPMIPPLSWYAEEENRLWESKEMMSGTARPQMKAVFTGRGYKSVPLSGSRRKLRLRR